MPPARAGQSDSHRPEIGASPAILSWGWPCVSTYTHPEHCRQTRPDYDRPTVRIAHSGCALAESADSDPEVVATKKTEVRSDLHFLYTSGREPRHQYLKPLTRASSSLANAANDSVRVSDSETLF